MSPYAAKVAAKAKTKKQKDAARMAVAAGLNFKEAARLVGIAESKVMESMKNVPDPVYREMDAVMRKALLVRSYCVGMKALDALNDEDFTKMSGIQKAQVAKICVELGAETLSSPQRDDAPHSPASLEDMNTVLTRLRAGFVEFGIEAQPVPAGKTPVRQSLPEEID